MSKLSFRARALDASKPMPIYLAEELPDLPDYSAINRAVPQMPSGMEKEEESEHHLQRAISGTGLIIPTPEVNEVNDLEFYERCYPPDYKVPKQHIHMQPLWEEQEAPEYDIDSEDERWLKQQRHPELTELLFEQMMDKLEKCSGQTVVTLNEAKLLLERKDDLVIAVYDYWLNKRLNTVRCYLGKRQQHPLILCVKTESRPGQSANNPYLAFRRRTEKMQTRKNRKNDESSYEKMLKLRRDLARALSLLQLVARREQAKRDLVRLTATLHDKRYVAGDFSAHTIPDPPPRASYPAPLPAAFRREPFALTHYPPRAPPTPPDQPRQREKRSYKRRKHRHHSSGAPPPLREGVVASSSEEESSGRGDTASPPDPGPFAFRRKPGCFYEMPTATLYGDPLDPDRVTDVVQYEHEVDVRHRYTLTSVSHPYPQCVGFARRRVGRGGRLLLDRVRTPLDPLWRRLSFMPATSSRYKKQRNEEVEFETKAHRRPKELSRDFHTSGRYPWRHAFRQHLSKHPHLWTEDVKPDICVDDVKMAADDIKMAAEDVKMAAEELKMAELTPDDLKIGLDDVKMDIDLPQNSDISLRTCDSVYKNGGKVDPTVLDSEIRENLQRVIRKRSWSGCSDTSYDSDESLYPVEREFETFIDEVNEKWLHFHPSGGPPATPPAPPPPLPRRRPFAVELRQGVGASPLDEPFTTNDMTLADLFGDVLGDGITSVTDPIQNGHGDFLSESQDAGLGSSSVRVSAETAPPCLPRPDTPPPLAPPVLATPRPRSPPKKPPALVRDDKERPRERDKERLPAVSPVPNSNIIVEEVNEVPHQIKLEKKKSQETIEEVVVSRGVQLKTVQTRHSPLKKHIISSCAHRPHAHADNKQILTVAVEDTLKVRLQNHLLSTGASGSTATVVNLVSNGPLSASQLTRAVSQHSNTVCSVVSAGGGTALATGSVSGAAPRRVSAPIVQLAPVVSAPPVSGLTRAVSAAGSGGVGGVVLQPAHTIHHVAPNKLKVLHAHPLTHTQRTQLLAQNRGIGQLPAVVSLAALGDANNAAPLAQLFEIKGAPVGKTAQLLNVVRPAARRIDLSDAKKRHLVATIDPNALKGGSLQSVRGGRVNVSVGGRGLLRAAVPAHAHHLQHTHTPHTQIRHQIHLKNRTFQVATPLPRGASSESASTSSAKPQIPTSVVANLIHKNVHLPKGGQKIAISGVGGGAVPAGVQAIALSAAQLKARQARLVPARTHQIRHSDTTSTVEAGVPTVSAVQSVSAAADGTNGAVRHTPPQDTLPMEVT